jgi:1,4-dihydroxy-2-naphthoate octaprenyltransferase
LDAKQENITIGNLLDRDTLLHLRLPFSYFLLPIFLFGVSQATTIDTRDAIIVFVALHLFIYPGSNIYNSYMDKDTGSIGGLKNPPPVTRRLYYVSIIFDAAGLLLCSLAGWQNMLVMAGYVGFSKAYSWHGIRFKKMPMTGWLSVLFFQGGYTYMLANMACEGTVSMEWVSAKNIEAMLFASVIIGGSYPLTQIYQHDEDGSRGDYTISYKLGVRGTFILSSACYLAGVIIALHYFTTYYRLSHFLIFACCSVPVAVYFVSWFYKSVRNKVIADYEHAMLMNRVSSTCMIVCFLVILFINYN